MCRLSTKILAAIMVVEKTREIIFCLKNSFSTSKHFTNTLQISINQFINSINLKKGINKKIENQRYYVLRQQKKDMTTCNIPRTETNALTLKKETW